jgi:hypothetical protein
VAALQHGEDIFGVLLTYNYYGKPTFYVFPSWVNDELYYGGWTLGDLQPIDGRFVARVYETKGPWWARAQFDPAAVKVRDVGIASMHFLPQARDGATTMDFAAAVDRGDLGLFLQLEETLVRQSFGEASPSSP